MPEELVTLSCDRAEGDVSIHHEFDGDLDVWTFAWRLRDFMMGLGYAESNVDEVIPPRCVEESMRRNP